MGKLTRILWYIHSELDHSEAAPQHNSLDTQPTLNENRYQVILLDHPHGTERVYAYQTKQDTQSHGATIQSRGGGNQGKVCARGDLTGNVWSPVSRAHITATKIEKNEQEGISSERDHNGILDVQWRPIRFSLYVDNFDVNM